MSRPTKLIIDSNALLHNLAQIKSLAPHSKIIAMVKANAYGCGISNVVPVLDEKVEAFGVACLEEALKIRALGAKTNCLIFQGIFSADELECITKNQFSMVLHNPQQLQWLLNANLSIPIKLWVKVNTGMNRLGFKPCEIPDILKALKHCPWVDNDLGLMTHMACADEPKRSENLNQLKLFDTLKELGFTKRSIANSASLCAFPQSHVDVVRPGIMLYGVSPFAEKTALDLNLKPVMRFISALSAIHHNPPLSQVGYGGRWQSDRPSIIGIVAAGYGDGYPRHIQDNTPVWIQGRELPIVGRVSMDMLAVDLTSYPAVEVGMPVELWGENLLVERIAASAGTIAYELLCQISDRAREKPMDNN